MSDTVQRQRTSSRLGPYVLVTKGLSLSAMRTAGRAFADVGVGDACWFGGV